MKLNPENIEIAYYISTSWIKNIVRIQRSKSSIYFSRVSDTNTSSYFPTSAEWIKIKKVVKGVHIISSAFKKKRKCLMEALIAYDTLERIGISTTIKVGAKIDNNTIDTHAWLSIGESIIIGGPRSDYNELIRIQNYQEEH